MLNSAIELFNAGWYFNHDTRLWVNEDLGIECHKQQALRIVRKDGRRSENQD